MPDTLTQALHYLRDLGQPDALAACGLAFGHRPKVNAHIHLPPNFSAFTTVDEALTRAANEGVGVLGVSNYYDYAVYGDFVTLARQRRIFPLFGLEIIALDDKLVQNKIKVNDPGNPGKIYICGKGITKIAPFSPEATRLLNIIRHADRTRMAAMVQRLEDVFRAGGLPTGLTEAAVIDMVVRRHNVPRDRVYLQERHLCQAFQEVLFEKVPADQRLAVLTRIYGIAPKAPANAPVPVQNEIRSNLMKVGKPAYLPETFIAFPDALKLILELGGIPCYPTLADGAKPLSPFEDPPETLLQNLATWNIQMAEFIPARNTPEVLRRYVLAYRNAGLAVTAGTEHNTLDNLPIAPACLNGAPIPPDVQEIFWEGACIVAAHQFLTLHGRCGFVDAAGQPNPAYRSASDRLAAFQQLGEAVIATYHQKISNDQIPMTNYQ